MAPCRVLCCPCCVWHHWFPGEGQQSSQTPAFAATEQCTWQQDMARLGRSRVPFPQVGFCAVDISKSSWWDVNAPPRLLHGVRERSLSFSMAEKIYGISGDWMHETGPDNLQESKFIVSIILPHFEPLESASHTYLARLFSFCLGCHSCTVAMASNVPNRLSR